MKFKRYLDNRCTLSLSLSMNPCTISNAVKLMENATGPLTQFILTPLKKPRQPCSCNNCRIVLTMLISPHAASPPIPSELTDVSLPLITPIVCIRRLVTSNGYVKVCAKRPDTAPHCMRSTVVGSRLFICRISRFPCSLRENAIPEYGNIPSIVGVIPRKSPRMPFL